MPVLTLLFKMDSAKQIPIKVTYCGALAQSSFYVIIYYKSELVTTSFDNAIMLWERWGWSPIFVLYWNHTKNNMQ